MKRLLGQLRVQMPWIVIGLVFSWAAISIIARRVEQPPAGTVIIRIAHWQLEAGVREGFAAAATAYEKMHPGVSIVQDAIPETTYGQWMTTQLIGNTAPDILEAGMIDGSMMNALYSRYLLPISQYVNRPNPYNAGTDLAGVSLADTCKDGMRHSYIPAVQEYMVMPLSLSSIRIYYNKPLLKKLTGLDVAPTEYRAFIQACEKIRSQKQPNGQYYVALAGSRYHFAMWDSNMCQPLTYGALKDIDFSRDGLFANWNMFLGFMTDKVSFSTPAYRAYFKMVDEITREFPSGWSGLARDEAIFNFAQQKAVFVAVGIYEAAGVQEQAAGKFDLGLMDFPMPLKTDPEFGPFSARRYEVAAGNMPMAISRTSQHPEVAMDFLLFLTSREQNEKFNQRLKWIPLIRGARIDPSLEVFEPNLKGVFPAFDALLGPACSIRWSQLYTLFQIHQISYDQLAKQFTDFYTTTGQDDYAENIRNTRRSEVDDEHLSVELRQSAQYENGTMSRNDWIKHREAFSNLLTDDNTVFQQSKFFTDLPSLKRQNFYRYTPQAIQRIRGNLFAIPEAPKK